ncbi:MAG: hypothetical protein JXR94_18970 [Candidatus Hydrogenedentes bacterium]|nr:hypothetical protein [Candidatus Hydrogenedentota bacterium]
MSICTAAMIALALGAADDAMTYREAKSRIPVRELPTFWIGDVAGLAARLERIERGTVRVIARSPGGRPLHLVAFGTPEPVARAANFNSAIGARDASAYLDKSARTKPVVYFIGPVHGHEIEALTGLVNLIEVIETGRDLRGTEQPALRALADQCRILIVPDANPDGIARFEPRALYGMDGRDLRFWGQGTWADDSLCGWPECKALHPMAGPRVGFVGCYFNDAGVNPMHDEFTAPMGPEAPSLLEVAREEGPDLAVSLHSFEAAPALLRPAYVTTEVQEQARALAAAYYVLLEERGLPHGGLPNVVPEGGLHPAPFNLASAVYHVSGATVFTFECPHGLTSEKACAVDLEQILDIQLTLYEAMLRFALDAIASGKPGS